MMYIVGEGKPIFCAGMEAGAVYVAEAAGLTVSVPLLPGASVQFTGRLELNVMLPPACAELPRRL